MGKWTANVRNGGNWVVDGRGYNSSNKSLISVFFGSNNFLEFKDLQY